MFVVALAAALATHPSPLAQVAARLESARDATAARAALRELQQAFSAALGLPDERLHRAAPPSLRAATMDAVLRALHDTGQRLPEIREEAASLLASWDACALREGDSDLVARPSGIERAPAAAFEPRGLVDAGVLPGSEPSALLDALPAPEREPAAARCWRLPPQRLAAPEQEPSPVAPPPPPRYSTVLPPDPPVPVPGAAPAGGSIAPATASAWSIGKLHIGTAAYLAWILEGRYEVGVGGFWNPFSHVFARAGLGYRTGLDRTPYFSWGLGYDDPHPNTFSLQLNDWGPTTPSEGSGWRQAVIDFGYKLPIPCAGRACFSTYAYLDVPLDGVPLVGLRETVTFARAWFLRAGINLLGGGDVQWVYGFGRYDWRPLGISLSYDNWGPNRVPDPGFRRRGAVTLGVNGAF